MSVLGGMMINSYCETCKKATGHTQLIYDRCVCSVCGEYRIIKGARGNDKGAWTRSHRRGRPKK